MKKGCCEECECGCPLGYEAEQIIKAKDAEIAALKSASVHSCNQGVIDGLQAEIALLRNLLKDIDMAVVPMSGAERLYQRIQSALSDKKGAV